MHGRSLFEFYWRTRCHMDVGEWRRRCRRGVPFSFYRIGDETTLLPFSRGDTSVRPISLLFLRRSGLLAPRFHPPPLPTLLPLYPSFSLPLSLHLLLSLLGRFQYLSKFSEPAMNKLFPDFEYLSVLRGNGTAIEGPTTERTGMGDID